MNKKLFWLYLTSMWRSIRLVMFEKYSFAALVIWWLMAFVVAFILKGLFGGVEFMVLGGAFFLQKRFYRYIEPLKAKLISIGDNVEFTEDEQESYMQKFYSGKVLRKMRGEDVLKTGLFSNELIPFYSHFYLLELKDKNVVVPYEWILSIDFEDVLED